MSHQGQRGRVSIPSDALQSLLDLRDESPAFRQVLGDIIQIVVVLDASAAQAELRWRLASRTNPVARTGLHEAIDSGAVIAIAPVFLKQEIEKYIPLIATETGRTVDLVSAEWQLVQLLILFYEPIGNPADFALVDPKDADYALTATELDVDFVRTNDAHFTRMGLRVIGPEADSILRDYARSTSVLVTFKLGSAFAVSVGIGTLVETLGAVVGAIRALPSSVKFLLVFAAAIAVLHPKSREKLSQSFKTIWDYFRKTQPVLVSVTGKALQHLSEAAATSRRTRAIIESKLPIRTKQTALFHARIICIRAAKPLDTSEIARRILANGYVSRSKNFVAYVRRLLRSDRRFVINSDGLWTLRAAS
jgi:hypothetical protein